MLYPLIEEGNTCIGIEPSEIFSEYVRRKNIEVYNEIEDLTKDNRNNRFDLIMLFVLKNIFSSQKSS